MIFAIDICCKLKANDFSVSVVGDIFYMTRTRLCISLSGAHTWIW